MVGVDEYETSLAWGYGLDWRPVPVFQRFVAYTAHADEGNARRLESDAHAPERVLRHKSQG